MKFSKLPLVIAGLSLCGVSFFALGQKKSEGQTQEQKITAAMPEKFVRGCC